MVGLGCYRKRERKSEGREEKKEREREELLEILRSWCSHALDCVPSLPLITGEQSLFVVGGMPKMFPTVTIMKNLIECALFQGLGDFDNFFFLFFFFFFFFKCPRLLFGSPTSNNNLRATVT